MTIRELDDRIVRRICGQHIEAIEWLQLGRHYIHLIDDVIDEDLPKANREQGAERMCAIGAMAIALYSHPFFIAHREALGQAMLTCTNAYADSVAWEQSETPWQRQCSDWARHSWIEVALVVAYICGGYENMRGCSAELRAMSWADHHNQTGKVT